MAVPGRRNGFIDEEEHDDENALFEEDGLVDIDSDTPPHLRDLSVAAQTGDVNALRHALDNLDGSINEAVEDGDTALHLTCLYGYLPCVQLLLDRGANLEAKDEDGGIPLHDACAGGFTEIVRLLLDRANSAGSVKRMLDTVDEEGDTPLHHAARGGHAVLVRMLLEAGACPMKKNIFDKIPGELADPDTETKRILEAAAGGAPVAFT